MAATHSTEQIAKRYAHAFFALSGQDVRALMPQVEALLAIVALPDVSDFLNNPIYTRDQQASTMRYLLESQGFSKALTETVVRVAKNRRLPILPIILKQFKRMVMNAMGEMELEIISAKPLSAADIRQLSDKLSQIYDKKIHATASIDASLIGGIMLKTQDQLIDYSVAGKLARLGQQLKSA